MKRIAKVAVVLGMTTLLMTGCESSERKEAVKNIEEFSQEYEEAGDSIAKEQQSNYKILGESLQALQDISAKDSGELETEEQIAQANELLEEFRTELNEMISSVEESSQVTESSKELTEISLTFRNDSSKGAKSLSIRDPQSGMERELDSFEAGKKVETMIKIPVDTWNITWYLYNEQGECIVEETTSLEKVKTGATIYYKEDGVYIESY